MDTNGLNHEKHEIHEIKGRFRTTKHTNGLNHETREIHETRAEVQNHETHE